MKIYLIVILLCFIACNSNSSSGIKIENNQQQESGEVLFTKNCSQCHRPQEPLIGPALKDVRKRWENPDLLYEFVRNSQEVIVKDTYARELYEKWNRGYMQPFDLSNQQIILILDYCDAQK